MSVIPMAIDLESYTIGGKIESIMKTIATAMKRWKGCTKEKNYLNM